MREKDRGRERERKGEKEKGRERESNESKSVEREREKRNISLNDPLVEKKYAKKCIKCKKTIISIILQFGQEKRSANDICNLYVHNHPCLRNRF